MKHKTTSNQEVPSFAKLMSGKCPQRIYDNMKIILSRTTTSNVIGELFILLDRNGFVLVRLLDIEYLDGYSVLTVHDQESGITHVICHSINDDVPKFTLIKLNDVLTLANKI